VSKKKIILVILLLVCVLTFNSCSQKDIYNGKTKKQINSELVQLQKNDQDIRMKYHLAVKNGASKEELIEIQREMTEVDTNNRAYIIDLLDNYGWPDGLSSSAFTGISLAIMHSPLESLEKYYPLLEERSKRGFNRVSESALAQMRDRILMYKREKQLYGTQIVTITSEDGTRKTYVWPIDDIENINERRSVIKDRALFGKTSWTPTFEDYLNSNPSLIFDPNLTVEQLIEKMSND
jgi:hypothetical protein